MVGNNENIVLVTGASTGIGRSITEYLAEMGFFVYAGGRTSQALDELNSLKNVTAVKLDITSLADVQAAFKAIKDEGNALYGLVNNAAIGVVGALPDLDVESLKWQFEVNVFAHHRVVRTFLPMLKPSKGRIVNIGSIAGLLVVPWYLCAYIMSKYALEAYSEGLAHELARYQINVSIVEPGDIKTPVVEKINKAYLEQAARGTDYAENYKEVAEAFIKSLETRPDPGVVAEAVFHALSSATPHLRYVVGSRDEVRFTFSTLLAGVLKINEGLKDSWSFEEISGLLNDIHRQNTGT
ncbi:MAG: SDR family oxidoreductase [Candidatus Hodarchaeales archaeon]|jgi:NAD(P)-dependent dehydrogenase (short-subunit alcohol dehydrogenase family)